MVGSIFSLSSVCSLGPAYPSTRFPGHHSEEMEIQQWEWRVDSENDFLLSRAGELSLHHRQLRKKKGKKIPREIPWETLDPSAQTLPVFIGVTDIPHQVAVCICLREGSDVTVSW